MGTTRNPPEYTQDEVYQELVNLCEMAGVTLKYDVLDERIYARTNKYNTIEMSAEDIYDSCEHAGKVLGHELAHKIFEQGYGCFDQSLPAWETLGKDEFDEIRCDLLGDGLYALAVVIASNKVEKSGFWNNIKAGE